MKKCLKCGGDGYKQLSYLSPEIPCDMCGGTGMTMTNEQENHLAEIKNAFDILVELKYRKGQEEHGGNLFDKSEYELICSALDEAIDQVVYLITIRNRMLDNFRDHRIEPPSQT